jgi:hypothetical protein
MHFEIRCRSWRRVKAEGKFVASRVYVLNLEAIFQQSVQNRKENLRKRSSNISVFAVFSTIGVLLVVQSFVLKGSGGGGFNRFFVQVWSSIMCGGGVNGISQTGTIM